MYLLIFGCAGSSLPCRFFPLVAASRACSLVVVRGLLVAAAPLLHSAGSGACGLRWVWLMGSVVAAPGR